VYFNSIRKIPLLKITVMIEKKHGETGNMLAQMAVIFKKV